MSGQISHQVRVARLYRNGLKNLLSWYVKRADFNVQAAALRKRFDVNRKVLEGRKQIQLVEAGEAELAKYQHSDPYTHFDSFGGSRYMRNPPFAAGVVERMSK